MPWVLSIVLPDWQYDHTFTLKELSLKRQTRLFPGIPYSYLPTYISPLVYNSENFKKVILSVIYLIPLSAILLHDYLLS